MILIVDFGSQFTQLVARRVRELSVYSDIVPFHKGAEAISRLRAEKRLSGIVFSGGPHSVYAADAPKIDIDLAQLGVPLLGICYGLQLVNCMLGGKVGPARSREYGFETISVIKGLNSHHPLFSLAGSAQNPVWMSHGDEIEVIAPCLAIDATTSQHTIAAFSHKSLPIYGVQFHPEVEHSVSGREILRQFVEVTCRSPKTWDSSLQIDHAVQDICERVGAEGPDATAICALSGGVDSTVAAALATRALGREKLLCLFINNGLLRKNEYEQVLAQFQAELDFNVRGIDASELFLTRLQGITDPEQKRVIIGNTFIEVFEREARALPKAKFLVQGTLYPDVIESVSVHGASVKIKTHHNVGGLPEHMSFTLIEPLRALFKDEVRRLGASLGISPHLLGRHPFPGPGLGIRVLGEVTRERLAVLREADAIFIEELKKHDLYQRTWQAFVVLLPVRTVGVMGDGRTYENVAALRCVDATDGMTADWSRLPFDFLAKVSARIIGEVRGINRVVFDISSKPPATIEWE